MARYRSTPLTMLTVALGFISMGACGVRESTSDATLPTSTSVIVESTTTTSSALTTTVLETTTTTERSPLDALLDHGYTLSDEYVVDTVVRGIDSATGGLAVDGEGVFYQSDFGYSGHAGDSVYRIDPDGTLSTFAQSDDMESLTMTTFGQDGKLYQSSYGTDKVFVIDPDGAVTVVAEGISGPTGIVALADGTLFVGAYDSGKLHRVSPDGIVEDWIRRSDFRGINGLTIGPDGTLYASNHRDGGLFSIDENGEVTQLHLFPFPTSHVAYLDDALFVTSRGAFVVYRYDLTTGDVEIIAGDAAPGDHDGRGGESSFGRPNAITAGPDGVLYFNHGDGSANSPVTIRRIVRQP